VNTCSCSPGCDVTVPTCTCDNTYTVTAAAVGTGSCSPNVGQSTYSGSVCPLYCSGGYRTLWSAVGGCDGGWSYDYQIYERTANGNAEGDDTCPGHNTYRTANWVKNNNGCPVACAGSWAYSSTSCPPACGGGTCAQTQIYTRTANGANGGDDTCPQTNDAREVNHETHGNTCAVNCAGSWAETSNSYPGNCGGGWQGFWAIINTYTRTSDAANGGDNTCPATGDISIADSGTNNNACPTPAPPPPTPAPADCTYSIDTCSCTATCSFGQYWPERSSCTCDNTYTVTADEIGTGSCSPSVGQTTHNGIRCPSFRYRPGSRGGGRIREGYSRRRYRRLAEEDEEKVL
jgi:hypothetical protein